MEPEKSTSSKFLRRMSDPGEEEESTKKLPAEKANMAKTNKAMAESCLASSSKPQRRDVAAKATWQAGWVNPKWHSNSNKHERNELKRNVQRHHNKIMSACISVAQQPTSSNSQLQVSNSKRKLCQFAITTKVGSRQLLYGEASKQEINPMNLSTHFRKTTTTKKEELSPKRQLEVQQQEGKLRLHLTNLKSNANQIVAYYNRKCGLRSVPVFIFNSQDEYIRRILLSWGWSENKVFDSPFFNLKWTYKDTPKDYSVLVPGQVVNHFRNNQQMTSKGRLAYNLRNSNGLQMAHNSFFPRCFDLGNPSDQVQFRLEYEKNVVFIVLRRIYQYVKLRLPQSEFEELQNRMTERLNLKEKRLDVEPSGYSLEAGSFGLMRFEDHQNKRSDFLVQINLSVMVFRYLRNLKQKLKFCPKPKPNHILNYRKESFGRAFPRIQHYARMAHPFQPSEQPDFTKEFYATPSSLFIYLTVKYHTYFQRLEGNMWEASGNDNIWIIKPASNSRGNGIHLSRDCDAILNTSEGITNRIVQKYIERPLIFGKTSVKRLLNRKFDLRQWVLVTSYSPLRIFRFSECYLRICSECYEPQQIKQLQRHLTNYSFNKQHFSNQADSVASLDELKEVLKIEYDYDYDTELLPRIDEIIKQVIRNCSQHVVPSSHSFEMYGFDILIDDHFTPWLLQVNMSPACEERCKFLKDYCEVMGEKMLRKVLPPQTIPTGQLPLNENYDKYDWVSLGLERINLVTAMDTSRKLPQTARPQLSPERLGTEMYTHARTVTAQDRSDSIKTQASEMQNSMVRSNRLACLEEDAALTIQTIYKTIKAKRLMKILKQIRHGQTISKYLHTIVNCLQYEEHKKSAEEYEALTSSFVRSLMVQFHTDKIGSYFHTLAVSSNYDQLRIQSLLDQKEQHQPIISLVAVTQPTHSPTNEPAQVAVIGRYLKGFLDYYYFQDKYDNCTNNNSIFAKPLNNVEVKKSFERLFHKQPLINHEALMAKYIVMESVEEENFKSPRHSPGKKRCHRSTIKKGEPASSEFAWDLAPYLDQRCNFRKHSVKVRRPRQEREQWQ